MTRELIASPPVLAAGNWVWLLAPAEQERALVIAPEGDTLAQVLSPHFGSVERVAPGAAVRRESADRSVDLVAISRLEECASNRAWLVDSVNEARRVLRDGGCLLVTFMNPRWARRVISGWGPARLAQSRSVAAVLEGAGFSAVGSYYLQPYPGANSIIPIWAPAAEHHERVQHVSSRLGRFRPLVARLGGHALLYPGCACVGFV
ncbi:MAG TPA: hypothetical protein VF037_10350 [Gemmatimonadales bacterium]